MRVFMPCPNKRAMPLSALENRRGSNRVKRYGARSDGRGNRGSRGNRRLLLATGLRENKTDLQSRG